MSAIKWAMDAFDAFYAEEKEFSMALAHFRAKAKVEDVRIDNRTSIKMATIESDNMSLNRCSRFLGVSILVQRTSTGNVQIHTAKGEVPILDDVARVLRLKEQQANGGINVTDWATLAREGEVDGIREWYYFRRGNLLLNGSLTTPKPPTRLSLDEIRETVRMCLSLDMFERSRYRDCAAGRCTSSRANPCRWYGYGLNRCRGVRRETYATR
jgi:hypothetical protein